MSLLNISDFTLDLTTGSKARLLDAISLSVEEGETVGLVGESGSGKSLTARAVLGLLPGRAETSGSVVLDGTDVLTATSSQVLALRRGTASMVFQDPRSGINPLRRIGDYLTESLILCNGWSKADAYQRALELLRSVGLPRPEAHLNQFPHELSGGMLQRVMIAGALSTSPRLLICDEPTTALDVTTQAEIIGVLSEQQAERGMGMLFITHDLNLASALCDRIYVLNGGVVVEKGGVKEVFTNPQAAYTQQLVAATPSVFTRAVSVISAAQSAASVRRAEAHTEAAAAATSVGSPAQPAIMLEGKSLSKTYYVKGNEPLIAVNNVSLSVPRGDALAVVGESGSGKSTLARMIVGLEQADEGDILVAGVSRAAPARTKAERLERARTVQIVFQDPYLSLDPRILAGAAVEDALRLHTKLSHAESRAKVLSLFDQVGLGEKHANARPRTLSGGQRQRVAIARALAVGPDVLVLDEATSALDVSVQAQVLEVVDEIRRERGLTLLFVSHDLAVVRKVCETTMVMRRGEIVEHGQTIDLLENPQHAYTQLLLDSIPRPEWEADTPRFADAATPA
ncbi:dipeptide ABC transporter ATP-binding protein [Leifsonia sp. YAF41]|uniref:dipeptide ABC transporter ATP-binding protein n=1 Tax=Leifsonia sp. YAF41 TaxID=3233086 RepID=UPI003F945034